MLYLEDSTLSFNDGAGTLYLTEYGDDLGQAGDTSWAPITREYLNTHTDINIVMWSWCGGVSSNSESSIVAYLNTMSRLERDYPGITFIYMTGHLDGIGISGNRYQRNNQIRQYCTDSNKILFDFADIESHIIGMLKKRGIAEHIACNDKRPGGSAVDQRLIKQEGYALSQKVRKRIEEIFGWMKTIGGFRKTRYKGRERTQLAAEIVGAAYNLLRIAKLIPDLRPAIR